MGTRSLGRPALIAAALSLGTVACSGGSDSSPADGGSGGTVLGSGGTSGSGGTAGSSGTAGTGGSGGAGARNACPDGPGTPGAEHPEQVAGVRARLLDQAGEPAVESPQVCGIDVCVFIEDADIGGNVSKTLNRSLDRPAFKNGLGLHYAKFAYRLPDTGTDHDLGTFHSVRLPDRGEPMLPGAPAHSGPATLALTPDAEYELDLLVFTTPDEKTFRAAAVPAGFEQPAIDPALKLELVIATSPVDAVICPPAQLSVENSAGWAAGTAVEFFVHGVSIEEQWAPYGGWAKVSDGAVSADGTVIVTAERGGIPVLGVIGIRRAP